jgi:DNA-binding GntR family transcriptional regulator
MQVAHELSALLQPEKPRLADQVYEQIRGHIVEGALPPGTRLIEHRLTQSLGISRTPLREALRRLEQDGLIERFDGGSGLRVTDLTLDGLRELMGIRAVLEGYCARLAANRITDAELAELLAAHQEAAEALADQDINRLVGANTRFHDGIDRASRSPRCIGMINDIRGWVLRFRAAALSDEFTRKRSYNEHAEILDALRERDAERVERLVREHIGHVEDSLVDLKERSA